MGFFNFGGFKGQEAPENKNEEEPNFKDEVRKLAEWRRDVEGGMGMERDVRDANVLGEIEKEENKLKEKMGLEEFDRVMQEVQSEMESEGDMQQAA